MYFTYCSMPKGTSRNEATSNSEKIKPVALAIIELRLAESIRQVVSQSVEHSIDFFFKFEATYWNHLGLC